MLGLAACAGPPPVPDSSTARGVVYHDRNANGQRDALELGVRGVAVSNGREVVRSDWRGRWRLPVSDDTIVFVVKPRGWSSPVGADGLPRFFYRHKPAGSPALHFPGVAPTGELPASLDFPLHRTREGDSFRAVLLADPQPYRTSEIDYLARDVIAQLEGVDASFGLVLGDLVGDDLALFEPLNRVIARMGIPWWPVHGNHDVNYDAENDRSSDETWERVYGPTTYAFQVGRSHFLVLDDVIYAGRRPGGGSGGYRGGLTPEQLDFVRNYLSTVDRSDLVVVAMHIPLVGARVHQVPERRELLEILADHPNNLSLSGHTHLQAHHFLGSEEGFGRSEPHHHYNVATASGSWWRGAPDAEGIPHATMRDGAPNGFAFLDVEGTSYTTGFRAARRPPEEQLAIFVPAEIRASEATQTEVVVNVFGGSERTQVEMRLGDAAWAPLRRIARRDPGYVELYERERRLQPPEGWRLPPPNDSPHLWAGTLPTVPAAGEVLLEIRTSDPLAPPATGSRLLRIR